ncbi:glycerophosphodiester phosphodiesterase [Flavobacteriaceae bacterium UJ101]|nr:glycerophosphodiester phosphodiesterase [Flavobacteriaceae bacterium UJ101]
MFRSLTVFILLLVTFFSCKQAPDLSTESTVSSKKTISAYDLVYSPKEIHYFISAHRGGKGYMGYPENCLETIDFLLNEGVQILEIDLAATKDGKLVLLHDDQLNRTTTGKGNLHDFTYKELEKIHLIDDYKKTTNFKIPLLVDVLQLAKEKDAILMLDFKKSVAYKQVIDLVKKMGAEKNVVLISYNQNQAEKLHRLAPNMMLSVSLRNQNEYQRHLQKGIPTEKMIAFVGVREPKKEHYDFLHQKGIMTILGTLGNLDKRAATRGDQIYKQFLQNGADILSSDRAVEAQKGIKN